MNKTVIFGLDRLFSMDVCADCLLNPILFKYMYVCTYTQAQDSIRSNWMIEKELWRYSSEILEESQSLLRDPIQSPCLPFPFSKHLSEFQLPVVSHMKVRSR